MRLTATEIKTNIYAIAHKYKIDKTMVSVRKLKYHIYIDSNYCYDKDKNILYL